MGSLEAAQARILATTPHAKANIRIRLRAILDGVTVLLAIASIIFAYVQKLDSRDLKNKTELLLGSVTTGYVAEFPHSIPEITKIVQGTCSDLSIMADVPGYGQYSAPDAFYWYMHSIIDLKHRTVKDNHDSGRCIGKTLPSELGQSPVVRLLLFDPSDREASLRQQLPADAFAKALQDQGDSSARDKFMKFFSANPDLLHEKAEDFLKKVQAGDGYERFIGLLLANHRDHENEFKKAGISIRYARQPFITRVWLQDSEQAAFSFDHSSETEIAFQTRDPKLLGNFKEIFDQQWRSAVCYDDYWKAKDKNTKISIRDLKTCP